MFDRSPKINVIVCCQVYYSTPMNMLVYEAMYILWYCACSIWDSCALQLIF